MTTLVAQPAPAPVRGVLRVPGDKSISHRAILLAAVADGVSALSGLSAGRDVAHTVAAVEAFGAGVEHGEDRVVVHGGRSRLIEPASVVNVGNSGTGIRLLAGWAAAVDGLTVLHGDASIARRPMDRVAAPLREMGAHVDGRGGGTYPPLVVRGGHLHGIEYTLPMPSAQVKGAVLLAGLAAEGPTTVREGAAIRAHTEEMLAAAGVRVEGVPGAVTVWPGPVAPLDLDVPADPSQAAFWVVAATLVPGSDLRLPHVYIGQGRVGFLDVLRRMGADIVVDDADPSLRTADIRVRHASLHATDVGGAEIPSLIDEIPVLAVAAAYADGVTTFADAEELKVKESDRIATVTAALRGLGANVEPRTDGLVIEGGSQPLPGGSVDASGDHRIAMAMAIAALAGAGQVQISGWDAVGTSYPAFEQDLARCAS